MNTAQLSPAKRIAVLLLSIDRDAAARVMQNLSDDVLEEVARAMKELQDVRVDTQTIHGIYEEFVDRLQTGGMALGDVDSQTRNVLEKAFGPERGAAVGERAEREILARRPFAMFESLAPDDLAGVLTDEHPQIAAVFLAHLAPAKAGKVLAALPAEKRAAFVRRVATLERTPPEVVQRVLEMMRKKVKELGLTALRTEPKSWVKAAAEMLNNLGGAERDLLDEIEDEDAQLAARIREEMFTFDDLAALDRRAMQKVLGQIDTQVLAISLKAASTAVERNVFDNLSKRAGALVREERQELGPTPLSEVLQAQTTILQAVHDLMDRGEIRVGEVEEELL